MAQQKGFKTLSTSMKVVFVLSALWALMSTTGLSQRSTMGLPLFGMWVTGIVAVITMLLLDVLGPLAFLYGTWHRKSWAPKVAYAYIGVFVLNSLVALMTVRAQLGTVPILLPAVVYSLFAYTIHKNEKK